MAALCDAVLTLLRHAGTATIAAGLRAIGWSGAALALLGLAPP